MAHMISEIMGKPECFTAGDKPWHGLGVNVPERVTSKDAIKFAGLNWEVKQAPLYFNAPVGVNGIGKVGFGNKSYTVSDRVMNYREDRNGEAVELGIVSPHYQIIQNTDAFNFFDEVIGQELAIYETAGAIRDGRRIWILAKLPDDMVLKTDGGDDIINKYLLFVNSHDGTLQCRMFYTPVRVVCNNTLSVALRNRDTGISIRHKGDMKDKLEEAVRILNIANKHYTNLETAYQELAFKKLSLDEAVKYFTILFPDDQEKNERKQKVIEGTRDVLVENFRKGAGAELSGRTVWGAYNAVTQYADHQKFILRKPRKNYSRFESVIYGSGADLKQKAFKVAQKLSDAS